MLPFKDCIYYMHIPLHMQVKNIEYHLPRINDPAMLHCHCLLIWKFEISGRSFPIRLFKFSTKFQSRRWRHHLWTFLWRHWLENFSKRNIKHWRTTKKQYLIIHSIFWQKLQDLFIFSSTTHFYSNKAFSHLIGEELQCKATLWDANFIGIFKFSNKKSLF